MKRIIRAWILTLILLISYVSPVYAYSGDEHDQQLQQVLFGYDKKPVSLEKQEKMEVLEAASYLCIDQYNKKGEDKLECLREYGVSKLPKNVTDDRSKDGINYNSNSTHRKYTHKGWNYDYTTDEDGDKANWRKRKEILQMTVKEIFEPDSFFDKIFGKIKALFIEDKCDEQYNSFCALVYYVHILGDNIYAKEQMIEQKQTTLEYKEESLIPLISLNDKCEYNIIEELQGHFEILFASQKNKKNYIKLIRDMKTFEKRAKTCRDNHDFEEYRKCEADFMNMLIEKIPNLLENEKFFENAFG